LKEIIDSSKPERDRFTFECELLKRMVHHALPRVYRAFEDDKNNRAYMLMDYIEGPNLEVLRLQQPEKRLALPQVMSIMSPIIEAASYLHAQHAPIIHRDIKPSNIIVPSSGDSAVLVDLGIAKEYNQDATTTAIRRCSPGYGAPEQYARGTNTRTDIYGLGATFYALLTGNVPTDALYRITQIGSKSVDPLEPVDQLVPTIAPAIAAAIQRAMAINSDDRFATVEEFWQELNAHYSKEPPPPVAAAPVVTYIRYVKDGLITPVTPIPADENMPTAAVQRPPRSEQGRKRRRAGLIVLVLALVLLALSSDILLGTGILPTMLVHSTSTPTRGVSTQPTVGSPAATATHASVTNTPSSSPTTQPTQASTSPPTPSSGVPVLETMYSGTIKDQITNPPTTAPMALSQIRQNATTISGYFSVSAGLQGSGNFTGKVTAAKTIQFLVEGVYGHPPLFFFGQIQADGSMTGTYCSYQNNACDHTNGFGTWQVTPASPTSISNSPVTTARSAEIAKQSVYS
jgi:serine/threonine protein kinase